MMGIMVPETCWASNKICNKNHLWYLVGILFPHINDDARSKSLHICTSWNRANIGRFQGAITLSLTQKCNKLLSLIYKRLETIIVTSNLNNFTQNRPIHSYAHIQTPELKYALLILPKYELGKVPRVVIVIEHSFKSKSVCSVALV
jgi:hypothetical protein